MSSDYAKINPEILQSIKPILDKRSVDWNEKEVISIKLFLEVFRIALSQRGK